MSAYFVRHNIQSKMECRRHHSDRSYRWPVGRSVGHSCSLGFHSREEKDGGISIMQYIMQLHAADVTCDDKNTVTWHDMTDM